MKLRFTLLIILLTPVFFACKQSGLSKEKKNSINLYIRIHNAKVQTDFSLDSIEETTAIKIRYVSLPKDRVNDYIVSHMGVFEDQWNQPYDIRKDKNLTLEKYLDYCKANNKDPETYYKYLD